LPLGCSSNSDPAPAISGTIRLDGEPVTAGVVEFFGTTRAPSGHGQIKEGRFTALAKPGPSHVIVRVVKRPSQEDLGTAPEHNRLVLLSPPVPPRRVEAEVVVPEPGGSLDIDLHTPK
jgi:hypothetical protein